VICDARSSAEPISRLPLSPISLSASSMNGAQLYSLPLSR
jgi:hypothetical protein